MPARSIRHAVARIALFAMLFNAASPTLASWLFSGNRDVTARVLGIQPAPAVHSAAHVDQSTAHAGHLSHGVDHHAAHAADSHGNGSDGEHAAHGVFCSFCLVTSSVLALLEADGAALQPAALGSPPASSLESFVPAAVPLVTRVRGPPSISRA